MSALTPYSTHPVNPSTRRQPEAQHITPAVPLARQGWQKQVLSELAEIKATLNTATVKEPPVIRTSRLSPRQFLRFLSVHPLYRQISGGKGDSEIKAQENMQLGFNNTLKSIFNQQFSQQSGILSFLNNKLTGQIENPSGFDPATKAALNTSNTEAAAKAYASAQTAVQNGEASRGGSTLPSGVEAQLAAENANAAAGQVAEGRNKIALADEQTKQQNYWRSVEALSGVAQQENPTGYASEFNSGSGTVANLGTAYQSTQTNPLLSTIGGIAGGVASAGFSKLFGPKPAANPPVNDSEYIS